MKTYHIEKDEYSELRARLGDLSAVFGPAWNEVFINEGGLTLPGWRRPFAPGELRSVFMRVQMLNCLEIENTRLRKERQTAWNAQEAAEDSAAYYRGQLRLESRLGLMLHGLTV